MTSASTFPIAVEEKVFKKTRREVEKTLFPPKVLNDVLGIYEASEIELVEIVRDLSDREFIAEALLEAAPIIDQIMSPSGKRLEIDVDPDSGSTKLFCVLKVAVQPEAALDLLHRLDGNWYLRQSLQLRRHLNFTVELADDGPI